MKTLERTIFCKKIADSLMAINQKSYIRDKNLRPLSVEWNMDKQKNMFNGLVELQCQLNLIIESLSQL